MQYFEVKLPSGAISPRLVHDSMVGALLADTGLQVIYQCILPPQWESYTLDKIQRVLNRADQFIPPVCNAPEAPTAATDAIDPDDFVICHDVRFKDLHGDEHWLGDVLLHHLEREVRGILCGKLRDEGNDKCQTC